MSQASSGGIARSKDGIPQWSGNGQEFQEYAETCLLWQASTPYHKRYLNGAKLANELQGSAKRLILGKPVGWLEHDDGVQTLLDFLRTCLGVPQLAEISEYLNKYFRQSRRKAGETMADYVTRKCEIYLRARQALQRVQPHHQGSGKPAVSDERRTRGYGYGTWETSTGWTEDWDRQAWNRPGRRSSWDSEASNVSMDPGDGAEAQEPQAAAPVGGEETSSTTAESTYRAERHEWQPWSSYSWNSWYGNYYGSWPHKTWSHSGATSQAGEESQLVELLPDYVQGWYLLHDANLDVSERNIIQTALQGNYSLQRVAQELRSQWPEADLRRDNSSRHNSYFGEDDENDMQEADLAEKYDEAILAAEGMSEEGLAAIQDADKEINEAYAVIQGACRTLKEARARQKYVKLRKYYSSGSSTAGPRTSSASMAATSGTSRENRDATMTCLRCGKVGHRAANCPDKQASANYENEEYAPFVCYTEQDQEIHENYHSNGETPTRPRSSGTLTTTEAMEAGMGVIDGGATKTLASVAALEALMRRNHDLRGDHGVREDDKDLRPTFSFGNSSSNKCISTAHMSITAGGKPGVMRVHTIEEGQGPLLISIETLRSLKAIIDFSTDMVVFRGISDRHIIPLSPPVYKNTATLHHPLPHLRLERNMASKITNANLRAAIQESGETPPSRWTKAELLARLAELQEIHGGEEVTLKLKAADPLKEMITKLNQAKKKKETLGNFLRELGITPSSGDSMIVMERRAMTEIYKQVEPRGSDFVGFGKFAQLTYTELLNQAPSYARWVQATAEESDSPDPKLVRLARWLNRAGDVTQPVVPKAKSKGYHLKEPEIPENELTQVAQSSQGVTRAQTYEHEQMDVMKSLVAAVQDLQGEVRDLKEDKQRKQRAVNPRTP
ncbi:hypothetical protein AK812_SmicGene22509 [Symbiodinium microadriaticum]|uniref:CCHC-type domain-containing protein n=1 Tax=Symbiodinium microadriaticum TaxID=2951 RepID=A0A1Q9DJM3_SYMMI|nr:hypothetical protein AK812_SmicGene22509 [Symbiodinium microadriaticum]